MCWTVFLRNVNYLMLGLVFAHLWTLSMQQGDCDFETTLCGFQQDNTDDFDWTRQQGPTGTSNTGPSSDHTTGNGYYMYIETSDPQTTGDVARLISPSLSNSIRCLEFWYHMYGDSTDDLRVYTRPAGSSFPKDLIWSQTGDKGDVWQRARVHIEEDSDFKIVFEGERGTSYRGDIAIDDVSFRTTPCGGDCDFDASLCGYQQDNTDDFDWTRQQGSTGSSGTGPSSDHTTGNQFGGSYMFIEASSPQVQGDVARLVSPSLSTDTRCLEFWYHMYGDNAEELRVYQRSTDSSQLGTPIWFLRGDQGDVWYNATVNLVAGSNRYIVFEGVRGAGFKGDIAIDDISVTTSCGGAIGTTTETAVVTPTAVDKSTTYLATTAAETTASLQVTTPAPTTQRATTEGVTTLGGTSTEAVPSERDCNFDWDVCGYQQDNTDDFNWKRQLRTTATSDTGPSADHTGNGIGYYMYIEASTPQVQGDIARLISPSLPTNTRCLEFWYHMYGRDIDQLNVYQRPIGDNQLRTPIWSLTGNQGNVWDQALLDMTAVNNFQIVFEGVRGSGIYGDIAIDDVSFRSTPCWDGACTFDIDDTLCGYVQDKTDDFEWTRHQGTTGTANTGPSSDHTTGFGHYMYIETSGQSTGDIARLISPVLSTDTRCLEFWYHMYGDHADELKVYLRSTGSTELGTPIWSQSGEQGDVWLQATVDLAATRNFYVVFEGVRGTSYRGDIAIDDISFRKTPCVVTTVAATTTTLATTTPSTSTDTVTTTPMTTEATTTIPIRTTTHEPSTEGTTTSFVPSTTFMETTPSATTDMVTTEMVTTEMVTTDMVTTDMLTTDMITTDTVTTAATTTTPLQTTTYEPSTEGTTTLLDPSTTYMETTTSVTTQETTQEATTAAATASEYPATRPTATTTTADSITVSTQQAFTTTETTPVVTTDATTLELTTEFETTSVPTTITTTQQTSSPDPTTTLDETTKDLSTLSPTTVETNTPIKSTTYAATTTITTEEDTTHVTATAPPIVISSVTTISQSTVAKQTTTASHVPSTASTDVPTTQPPDTTSLSTTKQPQIDTTKQSTSKPEASTGTQPTAKPGPTKPSTGKPTTGKTPPCEKDCTTVPDYKVTGKSEAQGGLSIGIIVGAGAGGAVVVILIVVIIIVAVKCRRSNTNRQKDSEWEVANPMYDVSMGPTKNGNNNNKKGGKTDDDFYTFNMDTSNV